MKRILVLSNACFSKSDSNGRTLAELFSSLDRKFIAQFFVYGMPDFTICDNYYNVSDFDALRSLIKNKTYGEKINYESLNEGIGLANKKNKRKKTPLNKLLRELVWKYGKWDGDELKKWIDKFKPELIFLFLGDSIFLNRLAMEISEKYQIPIIVYSTENYYFKKYNYISRNFSIFYKVFYCFLKHSYKKLENYVRIAYLNTPLLAELYQSEFKFPCNYIFSPSKIDFVDNTKFNQENIVVSYLGNLGLGRHKALIELSEKLNNIYPNLKLDVYGNCPNDLIKLELNSCKYIRYLGFVSYSEVIKIMHTSALLIHVEDSTDYNNNDLKYAFSTKIADSICSGTPLLLYANKNLAETDFLSKHQCAFIATSKEELNNALNKVFDYEERKKVIDNAKKIKKLYFSNFNQIIDIIRGVI
ncbi:glycosyltransferase [Absiella sp. AM29-15]|uniref:glycosyltransferase n=1 Tax=Absiella sp. AM29-15 TaxID=2292278 RepID=UPI000E404152|nr:glycosyltransferase [Absiella sp. AM29-15]RGC45098.1 glycosyltransferase family 1 protein [Absiella sp. AM29-15]